MGVNQAHAQHGQGLAKGGAAGWCMHRVVWWCPPCLDLLLDLAVAVQDLPAAVGCKSFGRNGQ